MHAAERHQEILDWLRERGTMRVSEMACTLNVSAITIRRDVDALSKRGLLTRVHGGAVLPEPRGRRTPAVVPDMSALIHGAGGRELVVGLLVPAADHDCPEIIKGAQEAAAERGIRLTLGISQHNPGQEHAQAQQMLDDGINGLLITPCEPVAGNSWLTELDIPCVLIERNVDDDEWDVDRVTTDHAHGARVAVRHLAVYEPRAIALVLRDDSPHSAHLLAGYLEGLTAVGLPPDDAPVFRLPSPGADPGGRERLLAGFVERVLKGDMGAMIVHNDHDAIVLLQRLRARGVEIPDAITMVAYDDEVAALADVPLSAVAPPQRAVGAAAVDLLVRRLVDPERPPHHVAILPKLTMRASSTRG
ncbi:substrate-binding domain-containing protein [Streptomyces sp. NPDC048290]|uniref:substrate-binding domain-containing protein n=1 Tax=Streptomyces sp. NPDC048290 TaxID=3155811 RepID=UPI00342CB59A